MPTSNYNQRKNYRAEYLNKTNLEVTENAERVLKLEKRVDEITGDITFALIQTVHVNTDGIPYNVRPDSRDILVATPEAFYNVVMLLDDNRLWDELLKALPPTHPIHEK